MGVSLRAFASIGLGVAVLGAGAPEAKEFVYGSWVAAKHGVNAAGLEPMFKEIEKDTKGAVSWKLLAGGQIASARSTLAVVRDRVADGGMVIPVFMQKELPTSNAIFDLQTTGTDTVAVAGAATETVMLHCPGCLDEYKKHNAVFLAGYGTTPFRLLCGPQIVKASDFAGKKVRATGGPSHLFAKVNATVVNIPPNEGVEAMQRGAVDCCHGPTAWLQSYGYMDVAKHVVDYSFGFPRALGMFVMNRDAWNSLSLEQKKVMFKHLPAASARSTITGYIEEDEENKKAALARGIKFHKAGADLDKIMAEYQEEERKRVLENAKKMGAKDAEQAQQAFRKALAKWEKLAPDINDDVGKFAAALQREIYDKLDPGKL